MKVLAQRTNGFLYLAAGREKGEWSRGIIVSEVPCLHRSLVNTQFLQLRFSVTVVKETRYVAGFIVLISISSGYDVSTLFCTDGILLKLVLLS